MRAIWLTGSPLSFTRAVPSCMRQRGRVVVADAQHGAARRAVAAMAAVRAEREDDVVALLDVGDARPELDDDAGRLVAQHHRQRQRPVAVHDVPVAHAHAGGLHLHAHLAGLRALLLQVEDLQRLVDFGQHGGTHGRSPSGLLLRKFDELGRHGQRQPHAVRRAEELRTCRPTFARNRRAAQPACHDAGQPSSRWPHQATGERGGGCRASARSRGSLRPKRPPCRGRGSQAAPWDRAPDRRLWSGPDWPGCAVPRSRGQSAACRWSPPREGLPRASTAFRARPPARSAGRYPPNPPDPKAGQSAPARAAAPDSRTCSPLLRLAPCRSATCRLGQAKRRPNANRDLHRCWVIASLDPTYSAASAFAGGSHSTVGRRM